MVALACAFEVSTCAADFSHRRHLALKLDCTLCHAKAISSTKASDNLLPTAAVCAQCHTDSRSPGSKPAQTSVVSFNHALHAKLGNVTPVIAAAIKKGTYLSAPSDVPRHLVSNNPCEACHRGLATSDAVTKAAFPAMADCLVCHNRIDPPYSCEQCHAPGPQLRPASHTARFVEAHSDRNAKIDKSGCAVCHGRDFTCQGCH